MTSVTRGAVGIWVVLFLATLLAFSAVVLNAGHLTTVKGELQNAVDAAAAAGAIQLDGNSTQLTRARRAARAFASYHHTDAATPVASSQVFLGEWRPAARNGCEAGDAAAAFHDSAGNHFCVVTGSDVASAFRVNAVYVQAQRATGSPGGGPIPLFMSALLGRGSGATVDQAAEAVAITGGPTAPGPDGLCIPMVIDVGCLGNGASACPDGAAEDSPGPTYVLGLSSSSVRSAGWSVMDDNNPSDSAVCAFLQAGCHQVNLGAGVQIDVGQGNKFNGGCGGGSTSNCDVLQELAGQTLEVPLTSSTGDLDESCPSTYNGAAYVVGYATLRILAVNCSTNPKKPSCAGPSCGDPNAACSRYASGKCILAQAVCNHRDGSGTTGGAWTGTSTFQPVLVETRGAWN